MSRQNCSGGQTSGGTGGGVVPGPQQTSTVLLLTQHFSKYSSIGNSSSPEFQVVNTSLQRSINCIGYAKTRFTQIAACTEDYIRILKMCANRSTGAKNCFQRPRFLTLPQKSTFQVFRFLLFCEIVDIRCLVSHFNHDFVSFVTLVIYKKTMYDGEWSTMGCSSWPLAS